MARPAAMILILISCAVLATAVYADESCTQRRLFKFFEHVGKEERVFSPSSQDSNGNIGAGYVYDFRATKTYDPNSEQYGFIGGMYYYTANKYIQEVSSIFFDDIGEPGGTFANAEVHLRGVWKLDSDGNDRNTQELAIVGGQKGLAGAYGSVIYTKVGSTVWLVQGVIYLDSDSCKSARNAHISQVISA